MKSDHYTCVAKTLTGLEEVLSKELQALNYKNIKVLKRAVQFETDLKGLYMANLNLRTALSILVTLKYYKFKDNDDYYLHAKAFPWEKIFDIKKTFSIRTAVFGRAFNNSNYAGLLVKDAIVDRFREKYGKRPNVDKERPDLVIDVYVNEFHGTLSLNSSGRPLYQRGYRNMSFTAPLNECLAAGLVHLSGWTSKENFINPMCGSGTLIAEAAMIAHNVHPLKYREDFAFQNWLNYDKDLFDQCRKELIKKEIPKVDIRLQASDLSNRAVSTTRSTLARIELDEKVDLKKMNFMKAKVDTDDGVVMLNPPYDERLQEEDIEKVYSDIGDSLKTNYKDHKAFIFSSNFEALKVIGLKASSKKDLFNGKLPCKLQGYDLYEGSKRKD